MTRRPRSILPQSPVGQALQQYEQARTQLERAARAAGYWLFLHGHTAKLSRVAWRRRTGRRALQQTQGPHVASPRGVRRPSPSGVPFVVEPITGDDPKLRALVRESLVYDRAAYDYLAEH